MARRARVVGTPVRISEKVEQQQCLNLVGSVGGVAWVAGTRRRKGDYQGTMQTPGIPDVMGFLPDRAHAPGRLFFFLECKARGGRMSPAQRAFRNECLLAGVAHIVGGLDALIAFLIERRLLKPDQVPYYRLPAAAPEGGAHV